MAKWTQADALAAALKSLNTTPDKATVKKSELEVEDGCLVYSFDIVVAGDSKGKHEIEVDAGNGRILKTDHDRALSPGNPKHVTVLADPPGALEWPRTGPLHDSKSHHRGVTWLRPPRRGHAAPHHLEPAGDGLRSGYGAAP